MPDRIFLNAIRAKSCLTQSQRSMKVRVLRAGKSLSEKWVRFPAFEKRCGGGRCRRRGGYMRNVQSSTRIASTGRPTSAKQELSCPDGDARDSFLAQFLPHLPAVSRYAARKVRPNEVEDVIQDCLLRIMNHGDRTQILHPKSYLMMVARAAIVDRLRHETARQRKNHCELVEANHPVDALSPCRILIGRQELRSLIDRLQMLPERTRDMLLAIRVEGISFKAAADRYQVSVSTVEKQVASALAYLAAEA
jgi:RNA polymerase sigma factor (sigma-70 family)